MFPLDPKTIERLTKIICDLGGPYERTGRELEQLLHRAGWSEPPEYDGTPRIQWLLETLQDEDTDQSLIESLLRRICSPIEYDDGAQSAELVREEVNKVLEPEGLVITSNRSHPILGELIADEDRIVFSAPADLEARLRRLISDADAVTWLVARAAETQICEQNGAYVFALVGIGSFVEHLLLCVLTEHDAQIAAQGLVAGNGNRVRAERASLDLLIQTAHSKGWIQLDAKDFMDKVRDYRNFVHLRLQRQRDLAPDQDTVMLCWGPVRAVLNDLETTFCAGSNT
ncbi:hypothetical protein [Actinoallomurus sp. CA-150999]|uniref:hypothetical protein n=1 Tax=Actinoallomurus sp. CA-150999 TaxID=3239887 RepID=UPI003D934582